MATTTVTLSKEEVDKLTFPQQEVLESIQHQELRNTSIDYATKLGNQFKCKVLIRFCDHQNTLLIYTTVWGYTNEVVLLKGNLYIPIHRILSIAFF
jgi:uncharacterized protein (UPF0248 family)